MSIPEPNRRLLAILAADAVDYSRLMSLDDQGALAALEAARVVFREGVALHHGRIVDTAGDSVLAAFGTAIGAVSAALTIQGKLLARMASDPHDRRLRFRIGLHLGDVIELADGSIYGDGVNIAARLQGLARPDSVIVSESIRLAVKGKLDVAFGEEATRPLKNIPEPVLTWHVLSRNIPAVAPTGSQGDPSTAPIVAELALPARPSIAVLPFTNLSADADQTFFCDGVTEDIITELSRFKSLFVISRSSSLMYRGTADLRRVGKELGVRYVLEGSLRRSGGRVRVTGQLTDVVDGTTAWAERYDRVVEDIFELQEDLTRSIVTVVAREIDTLELAKAQRARPGNLSAYQLGQRAMAAAWSLSPVPDLAQQERALALAAEALALDPDCGPALSAVACVQFHRIFLRTTSDLKGAYRQCVEASERALAVDRTSHQAYVWRGLIEVLSATPALKAAGLRRLQTAHEYNPNDAVALWFLGQGEILFGDHVRGRRRVLEALRLSPRDPCRWAFADALALAHLLAGEYEGGLEWALRCLSEAPNLLTAHEHAAMLYVGLGRLDDARREMDWVRDTAPEQTEMLLRQGLLHLGDTEQLKRATLFYRVAAGVADPAEVNKVP